MGGSSLCVEVLMLTFGNIAGYPQVHVLDSTDPAQIKAIESQDRSREDHFHRIEQIRQHARAQYLQAIFLRAREANRRGTRRPGSTSSPITDPGSNMQQVAEKDGFRHIFFGVPSIGGRYSALSNFGMVPAAIQGIDVQNFSICADEMVHACASVVPADQNPGVILGAILGTAAKERPRQSHHLHFARHLDLGAWLEQLIAESTGKEGKGLIPVDREQLGSPEVYGNDRVFAYLRLAGAPDAKQDAAVDALEKAGQPVVRIAVPDIYDVAQEFFRWEIATAVAGSIIGINAFNQPDVEASKIETTSSRLNTRRKARFRPNLRSCRKRASSFSPMLRTPPR